MEQNGGPGAEDLTVRERILGVDTAGLATNYFTGTSRKIRSSLLAGVPRPSRLEVEK